MALEQELTQGGTMGMYVRTNECVGCEKCQDVCNSGAITIDPSDNRAVIDDGLCIGCGECERACPVEAIAEG